MVADQELKHVFSDAIRKFLCCKTMTGTWDAGKPVCTSGRSTMYHTPPTLVVAIYKDAEQLQLDK